MKILIYFADMLRADLVEKKSNYLIDHLSEVGGTSYTRCYSPGPDTPRGTSCLFSGQFPINNGVTLRDTWPRFGYSSSNPSIFRKFIDSGYEVVTWLDPADLQRNHSLPPDCDNQATNVHSLSELKNFCSLGYQNSLVYVQDSGYHDAVDIEYKLSDPHDFGLYKVTEKLKSVLECDAFDLIVIFSDHGCKFANELSDPFSMVDDNRIRSFLFIHEKGKTPSFKTEQKLTSLADVYPTVLRTAGIPSTGLKFDGTDLSENDKDKIIIVEDYSKIEINSLCLPDIFVAITPNISYLRYMGNSFTYHPETGISSVSQIPRNPPEIEAFLLQYSFWYPIVLNAWDTKKAIEDADGPYVPIHKRELFFRIFNKVVRRLGLWRT